MMCGRIQPRFLTLAVLVQLCSGFQDQKLLCPEMPDIVDGTLLQMQPWSVMSTIQVLYPVKTGNTPPPFMATGTNAAQSSVDVNMFQQNPVVQDTEHLLTTEHPPWILHPGWDANANTNPMVCYGNNLCYVKVAEQVTPVLSWTSSRILQNLHYKPIAKLVNSFWFWDTSYELYDCNDNKMGTVAWQFNWLSFFTTGGANYFPDSWILDARGNHVANIQQSVGQSWYSTQKLLTIQNLQNEPVLQMLTTTDGVGWGPFKFHNRVTIAVYFRGEVLSPPAMTPQFVALAFANQMAAGSRFGPMFQWLYLVGLVCCMCCCCCFCFYQGRYSAKKEEISSSDEKSGLLMEEAPAARSGGFLCCARSGKVEPAFDAPR